MPHQLLPPEAARVVRLLAEIDQLNTRAAVWRGWSPLTQPALVTIPGGGAVLLGRSRAPRGFQAAEADSLSAPVSYRVGFVDEQSLVNGSLAGDYRLAAFDGEACPIVPLPDTPDHAAALGGLTRGLYKAQVATGLMAEIDVLAGLDSEAVAEARTTTFSSLSLGQGRERLAAVMLEVQQAYELYPEALLMNNVLGNLEGRLLHGADAGDGLGVLVAEAAGQERRLAVARTLALVRRERYAQLTPGAVGYERRMEVIEGLPRLAELRVLRALADNPASPSAASGGRLAGALIAGLTEINIHGQGAARGRFEYSGLGLGLLLAQVSPGWEGGLTLERQPLDRLLESGVRFDGGPADERLLDVVREAYGYFDRLEDERAWTRHVEGRRRELVTTVLEGEGTRIAIDVNALAGRADWCDESSAQRIGESTIVHVRPGILTYGDGSTYVEFRGVTCVEELRSRCLHLRVPGPDLAFFGDGEPVAGLRGMEFADGLDLDLGVLRIRARQGTLRREGRTLVVRLLG